MARALDKLDAIDLRILRAYQRNPEISMEELGHSVGLSHTPCWRRLRRLEDAGIVRGKSARLDRELLGLKTVFFVQLRLARHDEETILAFENAVLREPDILDCYSIAGDHDYILRVVCSDATAYEQILKTKLLHLPGIGSINSHIALNEIKHTDLLPV